MRSMDTTRPVSPADRETSVTATTTDEAVRRNPAGRVDDREARRPEPRTELDDCTPEEVGYGYGV